MERDAILDLEGLQQLIDALRSLGYQVLGPTVGAGAIELAEITSVDDLPRGVGDEQAAGHYRTRVRDDRALFGFAATAQSAKPALFPAVERLWHGSRSDEGLSVSAGDDEPPYVALLGIRACDLAAILVHDTVLLGRGVADSHYAARRDRSFLIAVTCSDPAGTCFCASMGTGPKPGAGADLALTELVDAAGHRFLVEVGTAAGAELLSTLPTVPAREEDRAEAAAVVASSTVRMGREVRTDDLPDLLLTSAESPRWQDVADRCLACGNCTLVCPTCFCTNVTDVSDLSGTTDDRHRVWDSCFSLEYSRLHGGAVRVTTASRYRQWLTHKLGTWPLQFGMSGCVGCGRCITWCPAAIDLTHETELLREEAAQRSTARAALAASPKD